jgi:hypothetical protein
MGKNTTEEHIMRTMSHTYTAETVAAPNTARSQHLADVFAILDGSAKSCDLYAAAIVPATLQDADLAAFVA